jgi:Flp pilus assembly protein TadG
MILNRINNNHGGILIFTVLGLSAFLLLMAMAVDVTYFFLVRNQIRNIADNATLAAMGVFMDRVSNGSDRLGAMNDAILAAQDVGLHSTTLDSGGANFIISNSDVEFGVYDPDTRIFTVEPDPANPANLIDAVRVTVHKDGLNPRYEFYLKNLSGLKDATLEAYAVASIVHKNILFIMDISASMDDNTYPNQRLTEEEKWANYDLIGPPNVSGAPTKGYEYYDFKTYPVPEYTMVDSIEGVKTLGGRPQPIYSVLEKIRDFFGITLGGVLDQNDNIGFMTYNRYIQNRVNQVKSGNYFVQRDYLPDLAKICQDSMDFYDTYITDSMASSDALFTYNPAVYRTSLNDLERYDSTQPFVKSIIDYKFPGGPLDATLNRQFHPTTAMRYLDTKTDIIFPGGEYPGGEDRNRNKVISDATDKPLTGWTNMGGALRTARTYFNTITATGVPAFNMIILLSDGLPNIRTNSDGSGTGEYFDTHTALYYAKRYADWNGDRLKEDGVRICTIFYETYGASGEAFLRDEIATQPSTQYHFNAATTTDLDNIFNQILLTFPYVLVE